MKNKEVKIVQFEAYTKRNFKQVRKKIKRMVEKEVQKELCFGGVPMTPSCREFFDNK